MHNDPYIERLEVNERLRGFHREADQWRLSRLARMQKDGLQGRRVASSTALWNSFVAWAGRTAGSLRADLSDVRAWLAESRKPQEQCC